MMKRIHLFEFHDLSWLPRAWRNMLTDLLAFYALQFKIYLPIIPRLKSVIETLRTRRVIDLCSGTPGPILFLQEQIELIGEDPVQIVLTDKYPNLQAFRRVASESNQQISCYEMSVDATNLPDELQGFRTLFGSFHHFQPEAAQKILQDAVNKGQGIGVFEYTERNPWVWTLPLLFTPLSVWLITLFVRPYTLQRFFWTYVIPVVPAIAFWDGLVSCLRTYSPEELREITDKVKCSNYLWEIGCVRSSGAHHVTYLLGYPSSDAGVPNGSGMKKTIFKHKD